MGTSEQCQGNLTKFYGVACDGLTSYPGGVAILLVASCYGNRDKPSAPSSEFSSSFTNFSFLFDILLQETL